MDFTPSRVLWTGKRESLCSTVSTGSWGGTSPAPTLECWQRSRNMHLHVYFLHPNLPVIQEKNMKFNVCASKLRRKWNTCQYYVFHCLKNVIKYMLIHFYDTTFFWLKKCYILFLFIFYKVICFVYELYCK